ncbi:MAG: hypothetical protein LC720_00505 [Actinobacteria bacterium]|nr:hypothetical protein [Actinomycetota bacterium]
MVWSRRGLVAALIGVGVLFSAAGPSGAAGPAAHAARSCPVPRYPSVGYFNRLTVTGVSCATGSKLALAYFHCRTRSGGLAGRCSGGVLGYTCHEVRNSISTELAGRVTCRRRGATIVHVYQQNL